MAIARDSILSEQIRTSGTTFSYNFNNVAGNYLVIGVVVQTGNNVTITYNGVSMTKITQVTATSGGRDITLYGLANPATGTHSVAAANMDSGGNWTRFFTASYSGVELTGNPEVFASTRADAVTTLTQSVSTISNNDWLIGFATNENGTISVGSNTSFVTNNTTYGLIDTNAPLTPAGSYSMTINGASGGNASAIIVAGFKPVPTLGGGGNFFEFF